MNKESVLIVDDDLGIRTLISDMVQSFGYNCVTADSGMNALDQIRWQNFDTIIADIHMPEISGLDLIREVHKTATDIPFICITGHSSKYSYDTVVKAGAQDFITNGWLGIEKTSGKPWKELSDDYMVPAGGDNPFDSYNILLCNMDETAVARFGGGHGQAFSIDNWR